MLNIRHWRTQFSKVMKGGGKEMCKGNQGFLYDVKKLGELLRNILSFLGDVGDEVIC